MNGNSLPVIGFAGWSGAGKTTLIEGLIPVMRRKGLRVAVIKHHCDDLCPDETGRDSQRFMAAGAVRCVLCGPDGPDLPTAIRLIDDADVILAEGFKHAAIPRIGVSRAAGGKGFTGPLDSFIAVVSDKPPAGSPVPCFTFDETERIVDFIMENIQDFTHFDEAGKARMVNVGDKPVTHRTARAGARVLVNETTFALIQSGGMKKGDVLTVGQLAGIMGAKRTPDLIPLCHPVAVSGIELTLGLNEQACAVDIEAAVSCDGQTGVEMEALTAVSVAALTVYDMCKAVQKDMTITDIRLLDKTGGVHGEYHR